MKRYKDNLNKTTCKYLDLMLICWFHKINDHYNPKCTVQRPLQENTRKSAGGQGGETMSGTKCPCDFND